MEKTGKRNTFLWAFALLFLAWVALPSMALAGDDITSLKNELKTLEKKIEKLEKANSWNTDDIGDLGKRMDKAEMHTVSDKVSFSIDFRTKAESIHYNDMAAAPGALVGKFFTPYNPSNPFAGGFNSATLTQMQGLIGPMMAGGMLNSGGAFGPQKYDADNNIIYTNKFRLNMKAVVNPHLSFSGRLAAYKVFGDSTGVKFNQGSLGDVTMDGNTSSLPHGDIIHLERAYFVYKDDIGSDVHYHLSIGRRPSTDGPPLEYRDYGLVGGSPLAHIINWQFDGASLGFNFGDAIGIPGASFKLCYGVGFENDYGNSTTLGYNGSDLTDVHLAGLISNLFDNGTTRVMLNYSHAWDITDGFTGLTVMPFIVSKQDKLDAAGAPGQDGTPEYYFDQNNGGFITRMEPMTNIGDWDAATLLLSSKVDINTGYDNEGIDWFVSGAWSHTNPSQISNNPFYEIMGMGLLSSNGQLKKRTGYSLYAGTVLPMPHNGRLGLEYNWGSKYWFNFSGAEDSLIGSKLAVRGQVYEGYYIQPIYDHNFFVKLGAQYYDYEYTGSGNPLGAPVKISSLSSLDALNPVADKIWNYYASATLRF